MLKINFQTLPSRPRTCQEIGEYMSTQNPLKIGTRSSPLAMAQTQEAVALLRSKNNPLKEPSAIRVVKIQTTGDQVQDRHLSEIGGKGLFAKEIDAALLDGRIDIAIHSLKDLETRLPDGIVLAACLKREDPRDALIGPEIFSLNHLPDGATIGTASLRRQAQLLNHRPDVRIVLLRGNIQTRLHKVRNGEANATFLALAGLNRMGLGGEATCVLSPETMLPACGQGVIGITCREEDHISRQWAEKINHSETMMRITAERAMLNILDGTCRTPIGGLAELTGEDTLLLRGLVARPDGSMLFTGNETGSSADAEKIGQELGARLRLEAGDNLFC